MLQLVTQIVTEHCTRDMIPFDPLLKQESSHFFEPSSDRLN